MARTLMLKDCRVKLNRTDSGNFRKGFGRFGPILPFLHIFRRSTFVFDMNVRFKVQGCDDVKELRVPRDETVAGFIKRAQFDGLVPSVGIKNVALCDQSGGLFFGDCPISSCQHGLVCILWDECGGSIHDIKLGADQGDAEAQFNYGLCLHYGSGVSVDVVSAARYFKLAADQGHVEAQFNYGCCLDAGSGVSVDVVSAARYYKLAADQGLAKAQFNYGLCLHYGRGVSVDVVSAARYFKLAADQGLAEAQFNYGCCLHYGSGVSVDVVSATRYFKLAAEQGHVASQSSHGVTCYFGYGRHSDYREAVGSNVPQIKVIQLRAGAMVFVVTWAKVLILMRKKHGVGSNFLLRMATGWVNFATVF